MRIFYFFILSALSLTSPAQESMVWSKSFENLGTFSSPRATDLNGDKIKDIVVGAGRIEFFSSDSAVIALNGKNGSVLWTAYAHDQIFGSPNFMDITNDGTPDVFINGRSGVLKAINGKTGEVLWNFIKEEDSFESRKKGYYNFYNLQFIPDANGDGVKDILTSNGGDVVKEPYDPDRPPGFLMIISGIDGKLISQVTMPDGKETYMSPVIFNRNGYGLSVVYGTGGETIGGGLYLTTLSAIRNGDISKSKKLAESASKGFIAPPIITDLNSDGQEDIVAMAVEGRFMAFDGATTKQLWVNGFKGTEGYVTPAAGQLNNDGIVDFFTTVNTGVWPVQEYTISLVVDGKSGQIIKSDTIGYYQISSPVAFDVDNNGIDEILTTSNIPSNDSSSGKVKFQTTLVLFDFANRVTQSIGPVFKGSNGASTPWVGDLDNDGYYDIVYLHQKDQFNEDIFSGFTIKRLNLGIRMQKPVKWGTYMGSSYDGKYQK